MRVWETTREAYPEGFKLEDLRLRVRECRGFKVVSMDEAKVRYCDEKARDYVDRWKRQGELKSHEGRYVWINPPEMPMFPGQPKTN